MDSLLHFAIEKGYETVKKQIVRSGNRKHQEIDLNRERSNNNKIKKKFLQGRLDSLKILILIVF